MYVGMNAIEWKVIMKKFLFFTLLVSFSCSTIIPLQEVAPVQEKKSYLTSLKNKLNAALKRLKKAVEIEDVETQRIVVKELFGIFRLIIYAIGITAFFKYGVPFVFEGIDTRIQGIAEAIDSRTAAIVREADKRIAKINKEVKAQIKAVTGELDLRVQGVAEVVDSRIDQINKAAEAKVAKINEETFKAIKKLKEELHGTGIVGPGGLQYFGIHAPATEPKSELPAEQLEKKSEPLEYMGHH